MHLLSNGKATIIGITSGSDYAVFKDDYIIQCNGKSFFTRVGYYIKWIESVIGDKHC